MVDIKVIREIEKWGSYGKFGNKPLKFRLIKDLSDSHLLHIIAWIKIFPAIYNNSNILEIMEAEQIYRTRYYIFIPEYD